MHKTLNWKHTTKKRHPYELEDKRLLVGNEVDGEILPRKQAKLCDKPDCSHGQARGVLITKRSL